MCVINLIAEPQEYNSTKTVLELMFMNFCCCRNASLDLDTVLPHLQYSELERFTDCFNELPLGRNGGRKLGAGAFGSVSISVLVGTYGSVLS
jgi:hypothetical protein